MSSLHGRFNYDWKVNSQDWKVSGDLTDNRVLIRAAGPVTGRYQGWQPGQCLPNRSIVVRRSSGPPVPLVFVWELAARGAFGKAPPANGGLRHLGQSPGSAGG